MNMTVDNDFILFYGQLMILLRSWSLTFLYWHFEKACKTAAYMD